MLIKEHINILDDRLMNGLLPVVSIMSQVNSADDREVTLDFTEAKFVSPVFVISLIVYASGCGKNVAVCGTGDYLDKIEFAIE